MTIENQKIRSRKFFALLTGLGLLPIAIFLSATAYHGIGPFFIDCCKFELPLCFVVGGLLMAAAYPIHFMGKQRFAQFLLETGVNLVYWSMIPMLIMGITQKYF